jgi:hypothetical protein
MGKSELVVTKGSRDKLGSCLFCPYPGLYRNVYEIKSNGFSFRICHHCYDKLKRDINQIQRK